MRYRIELCRRRGFCGILSRHFVVKFRHREGAQFRQIGFAGDIQMAYTVIKQHRDTL